jgi:hypothetical protein
MVLTRSEKEDMVKQLYEEGKTIREIAKEVHMSFGPIGNIIRKVTGDNSKDNNNKSASTETNALRLFSNGNSPVDVAIKLKITSSEAEELYLGFWRLKRQPFLAVVYKELRSQFPSFIRLFKLLVDARISADEAVNLIKEAKQIPILRNTFFDLTSGNADLIAERNTLVNEVSGLQNEIARNRTYLQIGQEELKRMNFEIMEKSRELQNLGRITDDRMKEHFRYKWSKYA